MNKEISVYIHIPFCKSKCSYCDFFSKAGCENFLDSYVESLCNEILSYKNVCAGLKLSTLYIGGGTPSLLSVEQLSKLFNCIQNVFTIDYSIFEATIELNPDDVTQELILFLEKSFINRLSLGIQSLKQNTLTLMNRRASKENSIKALKIISENFTKRFSVDLIAGFPLENKIALKENIMHLLQFKPEHISLYSLCVEEGTKLFDEIENNKIHFDQNESDKIWLFGKDLLTSLGFEQYEVSNFSINKNAQSRHNLNYWHLNNYLGFGSGATGSIFYPDKDGIRYTNTCDVSKYINFWKNSQKADYILSDYECVKRFINSIPCKIEFIDKNIEEFEYFMMNFRLSTGVSKNEYEKRFGKNLDERLESKNGFYNEWIKKGLAEIVEIKNSIFYRLTKNGILFLNSFLENL